MASRSEEQKKDLKIKITVAVILALVLVPAMAIGPGLSRVVDHAKENKALPWAPDRLLLCARIYDATFREPAAKQLYEDLYLMYGGNDWEQDFELVLEDTGEDETKAFYMPWVVEGYDGLPGVDEDDPDIVNRRPAPVSSTRHPIFGKVMVTMAEYWEGERNYPRAKHLWRCLFHLWPAGSPEHTEAVAAHTRAASRSF